MTLQQKLQQYGQFGEGDMPAIKEILAETDNVLDQLILDSALVSEAHLDQAENLRTKIHALVDGKSMTGSVDDLWASINWTHSQLDEGKIDRDAAQAECDAAIAQYTGNAPKKVDTSNVMQTPLKGAIDVHDAFVTMTVPVSIAMRVSDNELGDSHYDAVSNLEMMLMQDMEEEYGIDTEMAQDYHASLGCYGDDVKKNGWGKKNDKEVK